MENYIDASLGGVDSFAVSSHGLRKKAGKQPRDTNGRWVAAGANVKWRSNGAQWAGTVKKIVDGKAHVEVKNPDGSVSMRTLLTDTLKVSTSKARLSGKHKYNADDGSVKAKLKDSVVQKELNDTGSTAVANADGYTIEAVKDKKDSTHPLIYQIFSPTGRSLGEYTDPDTPFDEIINDDADRIPGDGSEELLTGNESDTDNDIAEPDHDPLSASGDVIRVARDGSEVIVASGSEFRTISLEYGHVVDVSENLKSLTASGSWRTSLPGESVKALAPKRTASDVIVASASKKCFRVPKRVLVEIHEAVGAYSESDAIVASMFMSGEPVSKDEVSWLNERFDDPEISGRNSIGWSNKILSSLDDEASNMKYNLQDDLSYFGVGQDPDFPVVSSLIAVDFDHGHVYVWGETGFELSEDTIVDSVEAPLVLPLDCATAKALAMWKDSNNESEVDVRNFDWVERNVFDMAESYLDYEEIDDLSSVVASANDGRYTPQERSRNAKRQRRGPGGKFGAGAVKAPKKQLGGGYTKARMNSALPIVVNPWAKISAWASGLSRPMTEEQKKRKSQKQAIRADGSPSEYIYFAIIDNVDRTAVLDVIAISKENGKPKVWKRSGGSWVPDNDIATALQGVAPPPISKLEDPDPATDVISQVDAFDADGAVTASYISSEALVASGIAGYSLSDGSFPIFNVADIKSALVACGTEDVDLTVKNHIKKRAKALNRFDLLPPDWREYSSSDHSAVVASVSPLYGEYGEIIVAAGVPGIADTPSDWAAVRKLERYWTVGPGAAKIRWGAPGDLTRAHRHLAKYVGPDRAWGLAQKYHKKVFGVWNNTKDKG